MGNIINKHLIAVVFSLAYSQSLLALCNEHISQHKPDEIYLDNYDGTVTDTQTGLMWQKCTLGQFWNTGDDPNSGNDDSCDGLVSHYTWQAALAKANDNNSFEYSDWRLPNKNELLSLTEVACYHPTINTSLFVNSVSSISSYYWTSTPYVDSTYYYYDNASAWCVSFNAGQAEICRKNNQYAIRLVRDVD